MRRALFIWSLLLAGIVCISRSEAFWQSRDSNYNRSIASGFTPSCSQSTTFLAAATGYTLTADKTAIDTFICGGVTDGWFAKLDWFHMYAAPSTTNAALVNLIAPGTFNGTVTGSCTFTAYMQYRGDASTCFVDTGFNPNTATSPHYTTNSASYGHCGLTADTNSQNDITIGVSGPPHSLVRPNAAGNVVEFSINNNTALASDNTVGSWTGSWVITNNSTLATPYFNGANSQGGVTTTPSGVPTGNFYVFARDIVGSGASDFSNVGLAAAYAGGLFSSTDANNLHTRLNTYLTNYSHGGVC